MGIERIRNCIYTELQEIKNFLQVTSPGSPDLMRGDARRLRIDYIKPSIVNRGGRPRLAGGGCSESSGPAQAAAVAAGPQPRRARRLSGAVQNRSGLRRPAQAAAVAALLGRGEVQKCDTLF